MRSPYLSAAAFLGLSFALCESLPGGSVRRFSPEGLVRGVRQVRVEFTTPMVPFGDPGTPVEPFAVTCPPPGQGRWLDQLNWVYDFAQDLSAGVECSFLLKPELRALDGSAMTGRTLFRFSTGGPAITRSIPWEGSREVVEDPVFILFLDGEVDARSVLEHVFLVVEGLASQVSVTIVEGESREEILRSQWLGETPREHLLLIRPRQTLPSARRFRLVWGRGVASPSGVATLQDQVYEFETRSEFMAEFRCARENADRECIPLTPMRLQFSAPVASERLAGTRLTGPDGFLQEIRLQPGDSVQTLSFSPPFPPSAEFRLELPPGIRDDAGRPLVNADRFPLTVRTDRYPPLAKFAGSFGIIEASDPVLPVTVRHLESPFPLELLPVDGPPVLSGSQLRLSPDNPLQILEWLTRLESLSWDSRGFSVFSSTLVRPESLSIPRPHEESSFEVLGIPLPGPGFYVVELQSRVLGEALLEKPQPMYVATSALVTDLGVHLKWGIENSLIWVTSLSTARPVAGALLQAWNCRGELVWEGRTGGDGAAATDQLPPPGEAPRCSWSSYGSGLLITARTEGDMSFVHTDWNEGIEPWRFRLPGVYDGSLLLAHTILDRSLFRAGETVHMKHVLRRKSTAGLLPVPPGRRPGVLVIRHLGSGDSYRLDLTWAEDGVAESEWEIPRDAKLGTYSLALQQAVSPDLPGDEGEASREWPCGSLQVQEFRVPLMRAALEGPADPLVAPARIELDATVEYLSGGPAKGLPVVVRYQFQPTSGPSFDRWPNYSFGGGPIQEEAVRAGEEPEETRPELRRIPAVLDQSGGVRVAVEAPGALERPLELGAELEFRDPNGVIQTVSSRIPLWPAGRLAGIKTDSWRMPNRRLGFEVAVTDLRGQPLADVPVEVDLYQRSFLSHRKRLVGGFYAYEHVRQTRRLGAICTGTSDDRGIVRCDATSPASGNLILEARVADEAGRWFRSSREVWVSGGEEAWYEAEDHDRIDVLPEKQEYQPGESARFQVQMPFRRATALVTVEREGISRHQITILEGTGATVEVPLEAADAPNVFVSVLVVRGRVEGTAPTAFVDLGKPAYKLGFASVRVGWARNRLEVKVQPDQEVYRVRETGRARIRVTAADGQPPPPNSEVAVAVVDEGLLELAPNPSWNLLETMMAERGHGVQTSTAQMHVVGKRHFGLKAVPQGGGGGRQATRELFDTLLFWKGRVRLDAQGEAEVVFPLNDSVTSFRIVAVASGGVDRFGTGSASIRSTQELTLFPGVPPTAREGDRFPAEFTVRNSSPGELAARLTLEVPELKLSQTRRVQLRPGESTVVGFPVEIPPGIGSLTYDLAASADGYTDRVRVRQEVAPAIPVRVIQAAFARLDQPFRLELQAPEGAVPGRGGILLDLSPSLLGSLDSARDYMAVYPYGCLEQVLSQAVALNDRRLWDRWMAALPPLVDDDGLLRYFPGPRPGSDILTAYVAALSHEAGWPIPEEILGRMLQGLAGFAAGQVKREHGLPAVDLTLRKVAALEALSRYGQADPQVLTSLTLTPDLWPTSTVIDWYNLVRRLAAGPSRDQGLAQAEQILRSRLSYQGTVAGFSTEARDRLWWLMVSPDVNLARLILAFLEAGIAGDDVPRLVQGFVARPRHGRWDLTTANAWAALAVRKYAERFEAEPVIGKSSARLSGELRELDWRQSGEGGRLELPWPPGKETLEARHDGTGAPWIWVRSSAALAGTAVESGYRIRRQVEPVEQRTPGRWSVGDLLRVRLEIDAQSDMSWVVLDDPIPSGSVLLGTGLRDSALAVQDEAESAYGRSPVFEERSFRSYRAWWDVMRKGRYTVEYTLRLNTPGRFHLPPTRVEALYHPETFGELPNAAIEVEP